MAELAPRLLAIVAVIALGWGLARRGALGGQEGGEVAARVLGDAAFLVFVPALLFRTTAQIDLAHMPWQVLLAFFGPATAFLALVYAVLRRRGPADAAAPAARAITVSFGNSVQLGIPIAAALFGAGGLALHVAIVSLHAVTLLSLATTLAELDLAHADARAAGQRAPLGQVLAATVRRTVIHPVVLPVLAGLAWNLAGLPLGSTLDGLLALLGQAVVPVCLLLIGLSLQQYGLQGAIGPASALAALKLLALPALVWAVGRFLLHLEPLALEVTVMCAALPVGSNALLFAQRYRSGEAEATAAILLSTLAFALTAPLWLWVLRG
jgi:malonate transporter and related proteins